MKKQRQPSKSYAPSEDAFIKKHLNNMPIRQIAKKMGRHQGSVKSRIAILKLTKDPEAQARHQQHSWFTKGHTPFNAGKKMEEFMKPEQLKKFIKHRYKPGHASHNKMKEGSIVIKKMGKIIMQHYYAIKINGRWPLLHRHMWQQAYGPVPRGMVIAFKDGNSMNCCIENLCMMSKNENMLRNSIHNLPADIVKGIHQLRVLKNKIQKHEKQIFRHEQPSLCPA